MCIMIVDDHPLARKGIKYILSEGGNTWEVVEASNVKESMELIREHKPEIALIDLKLGMEDGLEIVTNGRRISPVTKYVVLTSYISQDDFIRAEKIGVDGYILKQALVEDINYVVDLVLRGKKYYDSDIVLDYKKRIEYKGAINQLSEREKEVMLELSKGLSNYEIAECLYISENTVKKHISSILVKLNLRHRTQVALMVKNIGM